MADLNVRRAVPKDRDAIFDICRRTYPGGDYNEDAFTSWVSEGSLYVAEYGGGIIGMIAMSVRDGTAWLQGARVDPRMQGRGFGTQMYKCAEQAAAGMGASTIGAFAEPDSPGSRMLENLGYHMTGHVDAYVAGCGGMPADWPLEIAGTAGSLGMHGYYMDSWVPARLEESDELLSCGNTITRLSRSRYCTGTTLSIIKADRQGFGDLVRGLPCTGRPHNRWWNHLEVLACDMDMEPPKGVCHMGRYGMFSRLLS